MLSWPNKPKPLLYLLESANSFSKIVQRPGCKCDLIWTSEEVNTTSLVSVFDYDLVSGWGDAVDVEQRSVEYCRLLEGGEILFFQKAPFALPASDLEALLAQRQADSKFHKNISYRPNLNVIRGMSSRSEANELRAIMESFSLEVTEFLSQFLAPYASHWSLDFASYRPFEEEGRDLPLKKRNDRLHVDAFPTRPTFGGRILRVFTNICPDRPRVWNIAKPFDELGPRYALDAGLDRVAARARSPFHSFVRQTGRMLRKTGVPVTGRSPYDAFMLRFHDYLKANKQFQDDCEKTRLEFPPGSAWLVFTDGVPHAALSGRFALEQTYIIPVNALVSPRHAPIRILESICHQRLSV